MTPPTPKPRTFRLLLDAHVHVYPFYPLADFLQAALASMPRFAPADARVLCLAERRDCHFFQSLATDEIPLPAGWRIAAFDPDGAVKLRHRPTHRDLWFVAGRQIATAERIEICSLFSDESIPDALPAAETLSRIDAAQAVPLLNWAPGKWLFRRAPLIEKILRTRTPGTLVVADTALRPTLWPWPRALSLAQKLGHPVWAGSDPLPIPGDHIIPGTYHTLLTLPEPPLTSIVAPLRDLVATRAPATLRGTRSTLPSLLRRLRANAKSPPPPPA
jgi:hypothetical protein